MAIENNKAAQEAEERKAVEVDINDTSLADGVEQEIDMKEDWQAKAAPAPKGKYNLKLCPIEGGKFEQGTKQGFQPNDPNGKYYRANVTLKIVAPGSIWDNFVFGWNGSTGVPRGKKMSPIAGLMAYGKVKLQPNMTDLQLARMFAKWLATEPILPADCDWSSWDMDAVDDRNPLGKLLKAGMLSFPKKPEGGYNHILLNSKGRECIAKLKVVKWYPKGATAAPVAPVAQVQQQPKKVTPKVEPVAEVVEAGIEFSADGEVVLED